MKKRFLIGGALLLSAGLAVGAVLANQKTLKTSADWSTFEEGYHAFGTSYEVPTMTYDYDGNSYPATCIVTYPDKSQTAEETIELDQAGLYTFEYTVNVNGEIHSVIKTIEVDYAYLSVGNPKVSSAEYYDSTRTASELNADKDGIFVKLAFGDTLRFAQPIYLSDLAEAKKLVEGYIVPSTHGSTNANQLFMRLTDADNPDIYVTLCYYSHVANNSNGTVSHSSSCIAKSNAQDYFAGIHQTQGLHTNDTYGLWSGVVFDGVQQTSYNNNKYDACPFIMGYDDTLKTVYGTGFERGKSLELVIDLDDPNHVTNPFLGFSSDRVFLSMYAESYSSTTMDFVIDEVFGVSKSELASNVYIDNEAPAITVNSEFENLPNGATGYYYPIPSATAYDDVSLNCDVDVAVYYDYFSENKVNVEIVDDSFLMDKEGIYSIVYTAYDASGNKAQTVKTISVFTELEKPQFDLPTHSENAYVGDFIKVNHNLDSTGGVGNKTTEVYYSINGGEKILIEEDGFRISELTNYEVTYRVVDMIGQFSEKSYQINVTDSGKPILEKEIVFPKYLISRGYYDFPAEIAYRYENNQLVEKDITLRITDDNGSKDYTRSDREFCPVVNTNGKTVNVKVLCENTVLQEENIYTIKNLGTPIRETAINLPNYFIETGLNKTLLTDGIKFEATSSNPTVDFGNTLLGYSFEATISSVTGLANNGALKIQLVSATNPNQSITARIVYEDGYTYFAVGNQKARILNNDINTEYCSYNVAFTSNLEFSCSGVFIKVDQYDDGAKFYGLDSKDVYVTFSLESANNGAKFILNTLCGYTFTSSAARDRISPVIAIYNEIGGTKRINDYYTIEPTYSFDVLSPKVEFTLEVRKPNGEYITALDGTVLNGADPSKAYDIKLEDYGQYYFTLNSVEDSRFLASGNAQTISYYIRVYDDVAPTITFKTGIVSDAKVGSVVYFPTFTVSDNITESENLIVQKVVLSPSGVYTYLKDDELGYKVKSEGTYRFMINVIDEAGNFTTRTFLVNVTK